MRFGGTNSDLPRLAGGLRRYGMIFVVSGILIVVLELGGGTVKSKERSHRFWHRGRGLWPHIGTLGHKGWQRIILRKGTGGSGSNNHGN